MFGEGLADRIDYCIYFCIVLCYSNYCKYLIKINNTCILMIMCVYFLIAKITNFYFLSPLLGYIGNVEEKIEHAIW